MRRKNILSIKITRTEGVVILTYSSSFYKMSFELDTLSYTLLTTIVGAAALLSVRNSKTPDIHPLLLNTQSDVSRLRHPEESAVYRSRMFPMGSSLCLTFDRSLRTMADFYKFGGLEKNRANEFLSQGTTGYVSFLYCYYSPQIFLSNDIIYI